MASGSAQRRDESEFLPVRATLQVVLAALMTHKRHARPRLRIAAAQTDQRPRLYALFFINSKCFSSFWIDQMDLLASNAGHRFIPIGVII
jgi:hypothetical protein